MIRECPVAFVASCRKYVGVPFKHRGRTPGGIDCAGLIALGLKDLGHKVFDIRVYGREPNKDGLRQAVIANFGEPLPAGTPLQVGDICLMCFVREPHHLAVISDRSAGGLNLLHSFAEVGRVVEHGIDAKWRARILEVYRLREVV